MSAPVIAAPDAVAWPGSFRRQRSRRVLAVLAVVASVGVGGFAVGRTVRSPADLAAARTAPTPSLVTAPVERRVLSSSLVTRGVARSAGSVDVALAGAVGGGAERNVVTVAPAVGDLVADGAVPAQVSGRPVFAVLGAQPNYRALAVGSHGVDVRQLEAGLQRYGFDPGPVDGTFDRATAAAVVDWYRGRGFEPEGLGPAGLAAVRVPAGELAFLPTLPRRVAEVAAPVGTVVAGTIFTLAGADLSIELTLNQADARLLRAGMDARVDLGDGKAEVPASVAEVASRPGGEGVTDPTRYHAVVVPDVPLTDVAEGTPVKVTVPVASTGGRPVLVVPQTALRARADGTVRLVVVPRRGSARPVVVTTGLAADGYVTVIPTAAGRLAEGDRVVVGEQ